MPTILEKVVYLLGLHGVDGHDYDRIDYAIERLVEVERNEYEKNPHKAKEEKAKKEPARPVKEHMGI